MEKEAVVNWIKAEMSGENVSEVLLAVLAGWERLNPGDELVWLSLPRFDETARRELLDRALGMMGKTLPESRRRFGGEG